MRLPPFILLPLLGFLLPILSFAKPNVILIMTDDQGWGDFGFHGNPVYRTPNLDALAAESGQLKTFYVSPVCSPTRANLMTGRYNYRTRCIDTFKGRSMMDTAEVTVAEMLKQGGYATGIFGKWHLGDCYPMRPQDQGFDEVLIHRGGGLAQGSEPIENLRRYTDPILFHNGKQVQTEGYCTDVYFRNAIDWMNERADQEKPFFIYLPTNAPHGPYHDVPEDLYNEYLQKPDQLASLAVGEGKPNIDRLARIGAMITNIDQNVGELMGALEKAGIKENTIVMFLVDNGPNTTRYVGKFRGDKNKVYEGGIRSPFLFHWPNRLNASNSFEGTCAHIDVAPTILEACGVEKPADLHLDGRSFLAAIEGKDKTWPERDLVIQSHRGNEPVSFHHFMLRRGNWKLLNNSGFHNEEPERPLEFELYDLEEDPGETNDLYVEKPKIAGELKAAYLEWFKDVGSTRPDNYAVPAIVLGTPHENPTVLTNQDLRTSPLVPGGGWHVKLDKPQTFDFVVVEREGFGAQYVTVKAGEVSKNYDVEIEDRKGRVDDVSLPSGDYFLEVLLENKEGKTQWSYQVEIWQEE